MCSGRRAICLGVVGFPWSPCLYVWFRVSGIRIVSCTSMLKTRLSSFRPPYESVASKHLLTEGLVL